MSQKNFFADYFDRFNSLIKRVVNVRVIAGFESWSVLIGQWILVAVLVLGAISSVKASGGDAGSIFLALGIMILGFILIFVSAKFLEGLRGLVDAAPTGFSSRVIPDVLGLALSVAAVVSAILMLVKLIQGELAPFISMLVAAILFYVLASAVYDDEATNIQVGNQYSPGEELISIPLLAVKAILVALPVSFGILSLGTLIFQIYALASPDGGMLLSYMSVLPGMSWLISMGSMALIPILLPLYSYVVFLIISFLAGIFQGLLSLKRKS
ncbi:MAG: hypothetical protein HKM06_06030 [Spirochaetales bacterium]|nr:hypothetical protein [Spirochaetales bacterium]